MARKGTTTGTITVRLRGDLEHVEDIIVTQYYDSKIDEYFYAVNVPLMRKETRYAIGIWLKHLSNVMLEPITPEDPF